MKLNNKISKNIIGTFDQSSLLAAIICHIIAFILIYFLLYQLGFISVYPTNSNLVNMDASWYKDIRDDGYYYSDTTTSPMAFFPLFPYVWKLTGLNSIGISIFNYLIFLLGFSLLSKHLKLNFKQNLLFLSTPSLFFCFIPYSESLFFLGSVILLIGLNKDNIIIVVTGHIITTFSRSVGVVFIPAYIFTNLFFIQWFGN